MHIAESQRVGYQGARGSVQTLHFVNAVEIAARVEAVDKRGVDEKHRSLCADIVADAKARMYGC